MRSISSTHQLTRRKMTSVGRARWSYRVYRIFKSLAVSFLPSRRSTSSARAGKVEAGSLRAAVISSAPYSGGGASAGTAGAAGAADRAAGARPCSFSWSSARCFRSSGQRRPSGVPQRSRCRYSRAASPLSSFKSRSAAWSVMATTLPGINSWAILRPPFAS